MEVGLDFNNIISYNENLAKGLQDKLFFLNRLNLNKNKSYIFVDFGCADGTLINALYEIMEKAEIHCYFIGYDISDTMINFAKANFNHSAMNVFFTTNWNDVVGKLHSYTGMESILILSSVIHEVYSYAKKTTDIPEFWDKVLNTGFKYICVRDMMPSSDIERKTDHNLFESLQKYCVGGQVLREYHNNFVETWGKTWESNKQFIHFLLKYRWIINWDREVKEDYFPIFIEEFLEKMKSYNLNYFERFRVPYLDKCWKEDFNIEIEDFTHIKAIFEIKKRANYEI